MLKSTHLAAAAVIAAMPTFGAAATVVIDSFDTPQSAFSPSGVGFPASTIMAAPEAVGGSRGVTADGNGTGFPISVTNVAVGGGNASVSNTDMVTGTGLFEWQAGGVDFTDGGLNDTFVLRVNSTDLGVMFDLTVDGATSTAASSGTGDVQFSFGDFGDLTNADMVSLLVYGPEAFDASFSLLGAEDLIENPVAAVPLPAGGLLLGSVLVGAGFAARRKKS